MNYSRRLLLPLLLALIGAQMLWFHAKMPPLLATHFGAQGVPNGWMSRDGALLFQLALLGLMLGVFFGIPKLLRRLPVSLINLPNREYWLAPARAEESLGDFENRFNFFGLIVIAFMTAIMQLVYHANLSPQPVLPTIPFVTMMGLFFGALIWFLVGIFRRFGAPPA